MLEEGVLEEGEECTSRSCCVVPPGWALGERGRGAFEADRPDNVSSSVVSVSSGIETLEAVRLCDADAEVRVLGGGVIGAARVEELGDIGVDTMADGREEGTPAAAGAPAAASSVVVASAADAPESCSYCCWSDGAMKKLAGLCVYSRRHASGV